MAGNATFEPASTSSSELGFSGNYLNGQRGARSAAIGPNLVRSGNFRDGSDSRMFGSGIAVPRGGSNIVVASGDFRMLSQCISLEPIVINDQISRYDELNRVMTAGENSFGATAAAHVKPMLPVAVVKDLKRFRSSVEDTCVKARMRANKMGESVRNLDKYCESVTVRKQPKSELMSNDRINAVNLKTNQIYTINQRIEDQPKNILLNKRVRTSVAESRAECQNNGPQMQPVAIAKDGNLLEENGGNSDLFEKIRKLAAGGEGWDKKIKRKRSVGMVFTRPSDNDNVPKRSAQNKIVNERNIYRLNNRDDSLTNRKRPMPPGSSSPPMAQWAGQRPQKMARLKKPNQDQNLLSFQNHSPSDFSSPISKNTTNGTQKLAVKLENVQSSPQFSGIEEFVVGENRLIEKKMGNNEVVKKNKPPINAAATQKKLFQSSKTGYKKNGSKPGRRLKKLSDRKGFSHNTSLQNSTSTDCTGASDDDREELLAAANHARVASYLACSSGFWKKMEPVFAPVSSENKSLISQQVALLNKDSASEPVSCGARNPQIQHQERESFSGRQDSNGIPFYQRVLSALIIEEDDNNTLEEEEEENQNNIHISTNNTNTYHHQNENKSFHSNGNINSFRSPNNVCEENMSLDERLLLELQSIGLCLETLQPSLDNEEHETIQHEVDNLKSRLQQQEVKKKACLEKLCKGVETSNSGVRELETRAMDQLVELAYRKLLQATKRSSRSMIHKVPKQAALAFTKRTLARCHKFEKSGSSCFNQPQFQEILNAPIEDDPDLKLLSDNSFNTSNRGKKKELFLDDIGIGSTSNGPKGKRSERDTTKSRKPKQKTGQMGRVPTPSNGPVNNPTTTRSLHPTGPTYPSSIIPGGQPTNVRVSNPNPNGSMDDLDPLDELGVVGGGDLVGPGDLNSFLNFDDQDMDIDFAGGLDIPMDDLTELF